MRECTIHVGWGCLALAVGAALVVVAVAVQAAVAVGAVLLEVVGRG